MGSRIWQRLSTRLAPLVTLLLLTACGPSISEDDFNGTVLSNPDPAPQFELVNQFDHPVSLDDFADSVVVLTFLYTNCPDVCPIVTTQLRDAQDLLGPDAQDVAFVAVSTDPERDTVSAAHEYLAKWGLVDRWDYLVGDRQRLEPVWKDYFINPVIDPRDPLASGSPTPEARGAVDALGSEIIERYLVIHSAPVFLIDREGIRRVVFTPPLEPEKLAEDIRALLVEE